MQCVILTGGLGTRLGGLTRSIPKAMISFEGKPFLEYQIEWLVRNGVYDVVLCVGFLSEQIEGYFGTGERFGVHITYSYETEGLLGTGGALKKAETHLFDSFLVMYGDSYLPISFKKVFEVFKKHRYPALMVVYKNRSRFDASNVIFEDGSIKMYDKRNPKPEMEYIDYGVSVLNKRVVEKCLPKKEFCDLSDLFLRLSRGGELAGFEVFTRFYEVGSFSGVRDFQLFLEKSRDDC